MLSVGRGARVNQGQKEQRYENKQRGMLSVERGGRVKIRSNWTRRTDMGKQTNRRIQKWTKAWFRSNSG